MTLAFGLCPTVHLPVYWIRGPWHPQMGTIVPVSMRDKRGCTMPSSACSESLPLFETVNP